MRLSDWVFRLGVALLSVDGAFGAPYPVVTDERESISRSPAHNRRDSGQQDIHTRQDELPPSAFSITQVQNENFTGRTGLEAMIQAFAKYNAELTPELKRAIQTNPIFRNSRRRMTGTVEAYPPMDYDYEFVSPIQIGTPPQTLYLDFDTGSADLWVFSSLLQKISLDGQGIYNPSKSTTARNKTGSTWSIGYGDGSCASGVVYADRVTVGAATATSMTVEAATSVSTSFTQDSFSSGIFGLGMSAGNTVRPQHALTFVDTVLAQLAAPVFTANLRHASPGNYNFGYVSPYEYTGSIQYAPISASSIYWQFEPTGYRIGPTLAAYVQAPWTAIADTGTTLLLVPDSVVSAYYAHIKGAAFDTGWAAMLFPCEAALPDFAFGIGNYRGVVPGRYINYGAVNQTTCYGGLQTSNGIGFSIFGDVALKAQFVVFDRGNMRVGFANKVLLA